MSWSSAKHREKSMALTVLLYAFALIIAWGAVWLLSFRLEESMPWLGKPFGRFLYWLVMRIIFWILPSVCLLRRMSKSVKDVLGFDKAGAILLWGSIAGLMWGGKTPLWMLFAHQPMHMPELGWPFVTAVLYAPLVEEITFRGAVLAGLETRMGFGKANLLTGILFLLVHLPGWYLEGRLMADWAIFLSSALNILLLGWILGFVAHKAKSVAASTLAHMLYNFFQRLA